jgi:hypothetical protein
MWTLCDVLRMKSMPIIKEETTTSSFKPPKTTNNITYGVENPSLGLRRAHVAMYVRKV